MSTRVDNWVMLLVLSLAGAVDPPFYPGLDPCDPRLLANCGLWSNCFSKPRGYRPSALPSIEQTSLAPSYLVCDDLSFGASIPLISSPGYQLIQIPADRNCGDPKSN